MNRRGTVAGIALLGVATLVGAQVQLSSDDDALLVIRQGDRVIAVDDLSIVTLAAEPFTVRMRTFPYRGAAREFNAVRITASRSLAVLGVAVGDGVFDAPFLGPGTGMAAGASYEHMILTPEAHHYIFDDPKDVQAQRASLSGERFDGLLELEWEVKSLFVDRSPVSMFDVVAVGIPALAVVAFGDRNRNDRIEEGELVRLVLRFEA